MVLIINQGRLSPARHWVAQRVNVTSNDYVTRRVLVKLPI